MHDVPAGNAGRSISQADIEAAFEAEDDGSFTWNPGVVFQSADGTTITGNVFQPKHVAPGETLPAIIFVNSWAVNEFEYIVPAAKFAKKGYIVFSYSTRGFGFSGGLINVAGPKDMQDLSAAIISEPGHPRYGRGRGHSGTA